MSRYMWIDARKAKGFEVKAACQAAEVRTSSYYHFKVKEAQGPSEQEWDEAILINEMRKTT